MQKINKIQLNKADFVKVLAITFLSILIFVPNKKVVNAVSNTGLPNPQSFAGTQTTYQNMQAGDRPMSFYGMNVGTTLHGASSVPTGQSYASGSTFSDGTPSGGTVYYNNGGNLTSNSMGIPLNANTGHAIVPTISNTAGSPSNASSLSSAGIPLNKNTVSSAGVPNGSNTIYSGSPTNTNTTLTSGNSVSAGSSQNAGGLTGGSVSNTGTSIGGSVLNTGSPIGGSISNTGTSQNNGSLQNAGLSTGGSNLYGGNISNSGNSQNFGSNLGGSNIYTGNSNNANTSLNTGLSGNAGSNLGGSVSNTGTSIGGSVLNGGSISNTGVSQNSNNSLSTGSSQNFGTLGSSGNPVNGMQNLTTGINTGSAGNPVTGTSNNASVLQPNNGSYSNATLSNMVMSSQVGQPYGNSVITTGSPYGSSVITSGGSYNTGSPYGGSNLYTGNSNTVASAYTGNSYGASVITSGASYNDNDIYAGSPYNNSVINTGNSYNNSENYTAGSYFSGTNFTGSSMTASVITSGRSYTSARNYTASVATAVKAPEPKGCEPYLKEYLGCSFSHNSNEIKKLQTFLRDYEGEKIAITGIYDNATTEAVKRFQAKYGKDVLEDSWGLECTTGCTYITTRAKINDIVCKTKTNFKTIPLPDPRPIYYCDVTDAKTQKTVTVECPPSTVSSTTKTNISNGDTSKTANAGSYAKHIKDKAQSFWKGVITN